MRSPIALAAVAVSVILTAAPAFPPSSESAFLSNVEWSGPPGSGEPFVTATTSGLLLTWIEPIRDQRLALRIAARVNGQWSKPATVIESDHLFVNWADFPSAVETSDGEWVVHWLERTAERSYAYHVKLARSRDRGRTWSAPVLGHTDRSPTEHGFVAMVPNPNGEVDLAWLDGRGMVDTARGTMSLRAGVLRNDGRVVNETMIDPRTCECCQVAMARTAAGLVAVYRDRSSDEIRDIAVARELGGRWSAPSIVAHDQWLTTACPVNGPSVAALENLVVVAWFTGAGGTPRVKAAFSSDGGNRFGPPIDVDEGSPLGRVHLSLADSRSAVLVWLEASGAGAVWRGRLITAGGRAGKPITIGPTRRTRDAGFPRTAAVGPDLFVAWTDPASPPDSSRVRVRRIALADFR
jgi:hypothetical protein